MTANTTSSNITPAEHLREVLDSYDESVNARLVEIMRAATRHLHAFVEETGLTREEWLAGIAFLTETGRMSDDARQEFILLSDTLGVSMLLEMINHQPVQGTTEPTVFGPFHVDGAPLRPMGDSIIDQDKGGEPLRVSGTVKNIRGDALAGATIDVWQVQANGLYDVQDDSGMNMRGIFTTGGDGRYDFVTVRPVDYTIPDDGPVGRMLRASGRHPWRPAHIHMVVSAPGYKPVITHVFDAASPYLDSDVVFGVRDSLVIRMDGGAAHFDVVLQTV
jgi:hydroxyquinol 1,2-dioxygenase